MHEPLCALTHLNVSDCALALSGLNAVARAALHCPSLVHLELSGNVAPPPHSEAEDDELQRTDGSIPSRADLSSSIEIAVVEAAEAATEPEAVAGSGVCDLFRDTRSLTCVKLARNWFEPALCKLIAVAIGQTQTITCERTTPLFFCFAVTSSSLMFVLDVVSCGVVCSVGHIQYRFQRLRTHTRPFPALHLCGGRRLCAAASPALCRPLPAGARTQRVLGGASAPQHTAVVIRP